MILTDCGGEFISRVFEEFVVEEIDIAIIRTLLSYPQGNSINKAAHRTTNHTITLLEKEVE